jgi:hypothetical protein
MMPIAQPTRVFVLRKFIDKLSLILKVSKNEWCQK